MFHDVSASETLPRRDRSVLLVSEKESPGIIKLYTSLSFLFNDIHGSDAEKKTCKE